VASAVRAVVFVGDAMEEAIDGLCAKAGELGLLKVPVFMFQEGARQRCRAGVPRDRAPDRWGMVQVRSRRRGTAARAIGAPRAAYAAGGREALNAGSGCRKPEVVQPNLIGQMK